MKLTILSRNGKKASLVLNGKKAVSERICEAEGLPSSSNAADAQPLIDLDSAPTSKHAQETQNTGTEEGESVESNIKEPEGEKAEEASFTTRRRRRTRARGEGNSRSRCRRREREQVGERRIKNQSMNNKISNR